MRSYLNCARSDDIFDAEILKFLCLTSYILITNESVCIPEPARVVEPAESISVTAGDSATLECTISGTPDLKVKWFKDGKEMISGRKYKMTLKDNVATMKILTAERGDTSDYKMEVSNKVGKDQCTCSVTVLGWLFVSASSTFDNHHVSINDENITSLSY